MQLSLFTIPIFALIHRELLTALRRKRAFAVLLFTLVCAFFFTLLAISNSAQYNGYPTENAIRTVFIILTIVLFFAAGLFPMVIGAASICVERQQESWDLLATSLLRPAHIILAKWLNAVGFFLLLFIAIFPLIGVLFFFVGIDWIAFTRSIFVILCTACVSAAIGICASVFLKRPVQAIVVSFLVLCYFVGVVNFGILLVLDTLNVISAQDFFEETVQIWSPFGALMSSWENLGSQDRYIWGIVYQFVWLLFCLYTAWIGLTRLSSTVAFGISKVLFSNPMRGVRSRFLGNTSRPLIPDNVNPMYAKETRAGLLSQPRILWLTYFCATLLILSINFIQFINIGSYYRNSRSIFGESFITVYMQGVFILVLVPALAASVFVKDQELRNEDLLRGTLLRPIEIIFGKTKAIIKVMLPWLAALATGIAFDIFFYIWTYELGSYMIPNFLFFCFSYSLCFFYILSLSLACSVFCRRTVTAVVSAYVVNICLLGLLSLFFVFMCESNIIRIRGTAEDVLFTWVSPLIATLYNTLEYGLDSAPFNFYWFSHTVFFGSVSLLIYFLATAYFSQMRWRDR